MKRVFCLFLIFTLLICAFGCHRRSEGTSYTFYYPRSDYGYNTVENKFYSSIIEPEIRDDVSNHTVFEILSQYLLGPTTPALATPYPNGLSLISVNVQEEMLYITVTDQLSELTGIHLMITCACLGETAMELTNTTAVQISCEKALLDGKKSVILHKDSILFDDIASVDTDEQE